MGGKVIDRNGEEIGTVDDLLIDDRENQVRLLRVSHGGFPGIGDSHVYVSVDAVIRIDHDSVHIDRDRAGLSGTPGRSPTLTYDRGYYEGVYGWWGCGPYWRPDSVPPAFPYYPR